MNVVSADAGTTGEAAEIGQPHKRAVPVQQRGKKGRGRKPGPKPKSALAPASGTAAAGVGYAAGFDDSLEPDTDFALETSAPAQCSNVTALPAWACPAGRIRLLARQQARSSAIAAQRFIAEHDGGEALSTESGVLQISENPEVVDVPKESFVHDSFARTNAVLLEFQALHQTILEWA